MAKCPGIALLEPDTRSSPWHPEGNNLCEGEQSLHTQNLEVLARTQHRMSLRPIYNVLLPDPPLSITP